MDGLAIAAALTEINQVAATASIRTIYQPESGTFVLHLFAGREVRLLVSPPTARIHLTNLDFPHPQTPSPFTMLLRKHLRGGKITAISQSNWERVVRIDISRRGAEGEKKLALIAELIGIRGNLVLVRDGSVIASFRADSRIRPGEPYHPLPDQEKLDPRAVSPPVVAGFLTAADPIRALVREIDGMGKDTAVAVLAKNAGPDAVAMRIAEVVSHVAAPVGCYVPDTDKAYFFPVEGCDRMASFSAAVDREYTAAHNEFPEEGKSLRLGFARAIAKRKGTVAKLERWLEDANNENLLRHYADLIMIHLNDLSRGAARADLIDPATETTVAVPLNPRLRPVENAQAMYERAKRLHRGRPRVLARKHRLEREIALLETAISAVEAGQAPPPAALALLSSPSQRHTRRVAPAAPRVYHIDGYAVEVGKSAAQNDALLRRARPDDLWFHVKDLPGAHVIVHRHDKEEIPAAVIEGAARLAVRFSKGRDEKRVEVSYTTMKHVRKPKGAPPGLVILARADTLTINTTEHAGEDE